MFEHRSGFLPVSAGEIIYGRMRLLCVALALLSASSLHSQVSGDPKSKLRVSETTPDYWPGKYVRLPAGDSKPPVKLTYVTITKAGDDYQIEGFEGRTFRASGLNRSLDEFTTSSVIRRPLASFALGTASLQGHGVVQIVIDALNGEERFYLVRAQPLK